MSAANYQNLSRAPILEAIIDFTFEPGIESPAAGQSFFQEVHQRYPRSESVQSFKVSVEISNEGPSVSQVPELRGKATSADGFGVVIFNTTGLTISRLKPYESWEKFIDTGIDALQKYIKTFAPKTINRMGLRYINRFEFKTDSVNLGDYLQTYPVVGAEIGLPLSEYSLRCVIQNPQIAAIGVLNQSATPDPSAPGPNFIFDIDVFKVGQFAVDTKELMKHLSDLHKFKNSLFFSSITQRAVEEFR